VDFRLGSLFYAPMSNVIVWDIEQPKPDPGPQVTFLGTTDPAANRQRISLISSARVSKLSAPRFARVAEDEIAQARR
jgi:hypothetical protein